MTPFLADLIRAASEEHLGPILERLFPGEADDLIAAFRRLRQMEPAPDVGLVLWLSHDGDEVFVGGTDPGSGNEVALDFCPWAAWLCLTVPDALLAEFDPEEIVAYVLGEMTFYGATEAVAADTLREVLRLPPDGGQGPSSPDE